MKNVVKSVALLLLISLGLSSCIIVHPHYYRPHHPHVHYHHGYMR